MIVVADALNIISRSGGAFASRWAHVVVGITWIGLLYYFNFVQVPAFAEMDAAARNNALDKLAWRALWWFRWAAVATVATGIMILLFQPGNGAKIQLTDTDYLKTTAGMSIATGPSVPPVTAIYVQAGAFTNVTNAATVAARLQSAGARVYPGQKDGKPIYRVRVGPFQQVQDADAALAQVQALGHNDVQIVVDSATS